MTFDELKTLLQLDDPFTDEQILESTQLFASLSGEACVFAFQEMLKTAKPWTLNNANARWAKNATFNETFRRIREYTATLPHPPDVTEVTAKSMVLDHCTMVARLAKEMSTCIREDVPLTPLQHKWLFDQIADLTFASQTVIEMVKHSWPITPEDA